MEYRMSRLIVNQIQGDAVSKNIEIPSGHTLYAPGHVIQCQVQTQTVGNSSHDADITAQNTTGEGFANAMTVNTVNITPKFSNSKILMQWSGQLYIEGSAGGGADIFFGKDGSNILTTGGNRNAVGFVYTASGADTDIYGQWSCQWSFTANQTTQMVLKVKIGAYNSNKSARLQHDGSTTLTVWEIAQ
jgi:hypothetical protein